MNNKPKSDQRRSCTVVAVLAAVDWLSPLTEAVVGEERLRLVGQATGPEQLNELLARTAPDVLLFHTEPADNPIGRITALRRAFPLLRIVAISSIIHPDFAEIVMRSGAAGFCSLRDDPSEIAAALEDVATGHVHVSEAVPRQSSRNSLATKLLRRSRTAHKLRPDRRHPRQKPATQH